VPKIEDQNPMSYPSELRLREASFYDGTHACLRREAMADGVTGWAVSPITDQ
jgi:hypothetical protein